jgi:hypothetical protein
VPRRGRRQSRTLLRAVVLNAVPGGYLRTGARSFTHFVWLLLNMGNILAKERCLCQIDEQKSSLLCISPVRPSRSTRSVAEFVDDLQEWISSGRQILCRCRKFSRADGFTKTLQTRQLALSQLSTYLHVWALIPVVISTISCAVLYLQTDWLVQATQVQGTQALQPLFVIRL